MAAYFIVDIDVHDPEAYEEYRKHVPATLAQYGGEFMVRGGKIEALEGNWQPKRIVIVKFESIEQFHKWYNSPEYEPVKQMRFAASTASAIVVEGV